MSNVIDNNKQVAKELTLAVAAKMHIPTTDDKKSLDFIKFSEDIAKVYSVIYQEVKKD